MNIKQFAINNISRNIKAYLGYLASIVISSSLLFSFIMFTSHPDLDVKQNSLTFQVKRTCVSIS